MRASFATADGAAPAPLRAVAKSVGRRDGAQKSWEDDDPDDDRSARTRRQAEARASIALFSVALLWCSSLSAADALVSAFLPAPHLPDAVSTAVSRLVTQARREDADYVACAHRQSDGCVADVLLAAELESRRASAAAARNDMAIAAARRVAARCVAAEARVSSLVRVAHTRRAPLDVPWRDRTCPLASDRDATRARVSNPGDTLADAADQVSDAAATFRVSSEDALSSATRALRLRAAYDVSYARNKTDVLTLAPIRIHTNVTAEVEALAARASAGLAALEAETASALAASASVAGDALVSARDDVADVFEEYVDAVRAYATEATIKLSSAAGWFDAFARVGGWAVDAIAAVAGDVPDVAAPSTPRFGSATFPASRSRWTSPRARTTSRLRSRRASRRCPARRATRGTRWCARRLAFRRRWRRRRTSRVSPPSSTITTRPRVARAANQARRRRSRRRRRWKSARASPRRPARRFSRTEPPPSRVSSNRNAPPRSPRRIAASTRDTTRDTTPRPSPPTPPPAPPTPE